MKIVNLLGLGICLLSFNIVCMDKNREQRPLTPSQELKIWQYNNMRELEIERRRDMHFLQIESKLQLKMLVVETERKYGKLD